MSASQSATSFRDGLQPRRSDVFIAVMGVTGAGKSTFISKCCNKKIAIGHNLQACTTTVDVYPCEISAATTVYLVDTPGFDDTNRSDTEVLREIATWLTDSFRATIQLNGIIYLHRISDVRMQGSAKKNLFMFKKLCGPNALQNVILATTMWDRVPEAEGRARERELTSTSDFWGWMVDHGSRVFRHGGSRESALKLIQILMNDNVRVTLELQQQMVNENKNLDDTDAGKEVQAEIIKERKKFEKMFAEVQLQKEEALKAQDKEAARAMTELQGEYNARIAQLENSSAKLKTNMEKLLKDKYQKLKAKMEEQEARHEKELKRLERERRRQKVELKREKEANRQREKDREREKEAARQRKKNSERERKALEEQFNKLQIKDNLSLVKSTPVKTTTPRAQVDANTHFSVAIHGNSFYFKGPHSTAGTWQPSGGVVKHMTGWHERIIALGEQDSFMSVAANGDVEWSNSNIGTVYPHLPSTWKNTDYGYLTQIVLGTNGNYFIKGRNNVSWLLNNDILDHASIAQNYAKITVCALGKSGSYIIQMDNGRMFWNLKGHYDGLEAFLRERKKNARFAALSLTDDHYLVVFHGGNWRMSTHSAYFDCWKGWILKQLG